jgi:hypothetical protein
MFEDELAELSARMQTLAPRRRHGWERFCEAARLLDEYGQGEDKADGEVLAAIVLVESTIEALEVRRLLPVERVALDCGRRVVRDAWQRWEDDQVVACELAGTGGTTQTRKKIRLR